MNFFLVFQRDPYYQHERDGGYLWAPKADSGGGTVYHWENMKKVQKGDLIFSSNNRRIVSVNVALSDCYDSEQPQGLDEWNRDGWRVDVHYHALDSPIVIDQHIDRILLMQPVKYAPFNVKGLGNQGYLFEITPELAYYLLGLSGVSRLYGIERDVDVMWQQYLRSEMEETEALAERLPDKTEREQITKARIGQGVFRSQLLVRYEGCVLCGLSHPELLIASHIKPWRSSTREERMDKNNGLLLCPNHDALFDRGLITFSDDGDLLVSDDLSEVDRFALGVRSGQAISMSMVSTSYLKWHRENVFKGSGLRSSEAFFPSDG